MESVLPYNLQYSTVEASSKKYERGLSYVKNSEIQSSYVKSRNEEVVTHSIKRTTHGTIVQ